MADLWDTTEIILDTRRTLWFDLALKYKQRYNDSGHQWLDRGDCYSYTVEIGLDSSGLWYVSLRVYRLDNSEGL